MNEVIVATHAQKTDRFDANKEYARDNWCKGSHLAKIAPKE
jgi:hypothetical protein